VHSLPFEWPESVGAFSDGRILASGRPKEHLISVSDRQGNFVGQIGEPVKVENASAGASAILNIGRIVVDADENIYYVFCYLVTPTIRKYTSDGKLAAEWHPESAGLEKITTQAKKKQEESRDGAADGVLSVLRDRI